MYNELICLLVCYFSLRCPNLFRGAGMLAPKVTHDGGLIGLLKSIDMSDGPAIQCISVSPLGNSLFDANTKALNWQLAATIQLPVSTPHVEPKSQPTA